MKSLNAKTWSRWLAFVVAANIVAVMVSCSGAAGWSGGSTKVYSSEQLENSSIPSWNPTNSMPLTPDKAVMAAQQYANAKRARPLDWDVDEVKLSHYSFSSAWYYTIALIDRKSGAFETELVRVLMNGAVWEPKSEKK